MEVAYSHHLVTLLGRVSVASAALSSADPDALALLAGPARARAAVLSAKLDGSPLTTETVERVDAGEVPVLASIPAPGAGGVGWARALKLEGMETQEVTAVEYANLRTMDAEEDALAGSILDQPLETLRRIHGLVCRGLVEPEVVGATRQTEQAVHDGAQGMVIYTALVPEAIEPAMAALERWVRRGSLVVPPAVVAGMVHLRLLDIQPYEAGNGRVARAATRVLLRALGVDPSGAAVLEEPLSADASGYYGDVAATRRRGGDATRWLERHTSALAVALERVQDLLDPASDTHPPARGADVVAAIPPGGSTTIRDYATDVGVDLRAALADLRSFARLGILQDVPGGGGLRFERPVPEVGSIPS